MLFVGGCSSSELELSDIIEYGLFLDDNGDMSEGTYREREREREIKCR